jgi:hypothetical protein
VPKADIRPKFFRRAISGIGGSARRRFGGDLVTSFPSAFAVRAAAVDVVGAAAPSMSAVLEVPMLTGLRRKRARSRRSSRSRRHIPPPILSLGRASLLQRIPCQMCKTSTSCRRRFPPQQGKVHEAVRSPVNSSSLRRLMRVLRLPARGTSQ